MFGKKSGGEEKGDRLEKLAELTSGLQGKEKSLEELSKEVSGEIPSSGDSSAMDLLKEGLDKEKEANR
jgi:hypothetical protein